MVVRMPLTTVVMVVVVAVVLNSTTDACRGAMMGLSKTVREAEGYSTLESMDTANRTAYIAKNKKMKDVRPSNNIAYAYTRRFPNEGVMLSSDDWRLAAGSRKTKSSNSWT